MSETWKTTTVVAAAIVLIASINGCTSYWKSQSCYDAAAKGAVVECGK